MKCMVLKFTLRELKGGKSWISRRNVKTYVWFHILSFHKAVHHHIMNLSRVHECNKHSHETPEVEKMYIFFHWMDSCCTQRPCNADMFWETRWHVNTVRGWRGLTLILTVTDVLLSLFPEPESHGLAPEPANSTHHVLTRCHPLFGWLGMRKSTEWLHTHSPCAVCVSNQALAQPWWLACPPRYYGNSRDPSEE